MALDAAPKDGFLISEGPKQRSRSVNLDKWLVLVSAFVCQFFSAGFGNSLGIFYVEFLESFQASRGVVGWATSICSGLVFGVGLVVGPVVAKFGPRKSAMVGSLLSFSGLLISCFAPHIAVVYVAFGGLTGCGSCLICVSAFVAVGQHFQKGRGSASSMSVVGSGLGGLLLPIILRPIIDEYGWRGAMMILSAAMLNVLPAAGLFVPHRKKIIPQLDEESPRFGTSLCSRSMWTNASFLCFLIICPIASVGYQYTYVVVVDLGVSLGHNKVISTLLLTYISLSSTLSTLCLGLILRVVMYHSILLFNICLITMGIVMFIFPYVTSYAALVGLAAGYGVAIGGINGLYAVVPADLLGLRQYSTGLGLVCTVFGVGYLLSAPVAGALNDATGTYNLSFYVAASLCIACAIPLGLIRYVQVRRERREGTWSDQQPKMEITIS